MVLVAFLGKVKKSDAKSSEMMLEMLSKIIGCDFFSSFFGPNEMNTTLIINGSTNNES